MRLFSTTVFDDLIVGNTLTWYTSSETNDLLGQADVLTVQACTRGVGGTAPTLTVALEHSADAQLWTTSQTIIFPTAIQNDSSTPGFSQVNLPLLHFVRLRISLGGGTASKCYLKLYATGRVRAGG